MEEDKTYRPLPPEVTIKDSPIEGALTFDEFKNLMEQRKISNENYFKTKDEFSDEQYMVDDKSK